MVVNIDRIPEDDLGDMTDEEYQARGEDDAVEFVLPPLDDEDIDDRGFDCD